MLGDKPSVYYAIGAGMKSFGNEARSYRPLRTYLSVQRVSLRRLLSEPDPVGKTTGTRWTNRKQALERMVKGRGSKGKPFELLAQLQWPEQMVGDG